MSVLGKPQKDWDEFIERASGRSHASDPGKLFWIVITIAAVIGGIVLYRLLT